MTATRLRQRDEALRKANRVRLGLAALRAEIRDMPRHQGARRIAALLGDRDPRIESTTVAKLLSMPHGFGQTRRAMVVRSAGLLTADKRIDALTDRQRDMLRLAVLQYANEPGR